MQLDDLFADGEPFATFHDASVERVTLDYVSREAVLQCSIWVGNPNSADVREKKARRKGNLTFQGLLFYAIEPPDPTYPFTNAKGLWISDDGPLDKTRAAKKQLPENLPDGTLAHYFFVNDWNAFIYVAAQAARFEWTE